MINPTSPRRVFGRKGKVIVLLALSLTAIISSIALVAEGGMMMDNRRRLQSAADIAAMDAAINLFSNYQANKGVDVNNAARDAARAAAADQGFAYNATGVTMTVNIPPLSGNHVGEKGYVEVILEYDQPRYFSKLIGSNSTPIYARAVARGRWEAFKAGILVLDLSVSEALKANGGGTVTVSGADIIVNSSDPQATGGDGTGAVLKVTNGAFDLTGGVKANTTLQGTVNWNQTPTPDPLRLIPEPTLPANAIHLNSTNPNSQTGKTYLDALGIQAKDVGQLYVMEPGRYDSLPNFNNNDVVILKQASTNSQNGVYYLNGTGFTSTGATIIQDPTGATSGGLMLYNAPSKSSDAINLTGGKVVLSPPTSGPYKGIVIFQERTSDVGLSITGQGGMQISGTFYVAGGEMKITGSSSSNLDVIGSQYISRTLQSGGNGQYKVDWNPNTVAPLRQLALVE